MLLEADIHGFRGFDRLTLELGAVSVLIGKNSCGKTSVLQAIRLACAALSFALSQEALAPRVKGDVGALLQGAGDPWIWLLERGVVRDDESFLLTENWSELFTPEWRDKGLEILLRFEPSDFIQHIWVKLAAGRAEALRVSVAVKSDKARERIAGLRENSRQAGAVLREVLRGQEPLAVLVPSFYGATRQEEHQSRAVIAHLLASGEQARCVRNLVARVEDLAPLNQALFDSVGAQLVSRPSGDQLEDQRHLRVFFKDSNGSLELASAGTGLVSLVALLSALRWYQTQRLRRQLLILLDEPEAHLHPSLQADTGVQVADLARTFRAQLIMATHSVEIINRLGPPSGDAVLLAVDRTQQTATRLDSESAVINELQRWCDLSPFAGLNLLRSRRILFHEGKSDAAILDACARVYFANDPGKRDTYRRWSKVPLNGVDNSDAKDLLERALAPLLQQDRKDPVRLVRLLDRDYHRTPRLGPSERRGSANLESFEVVWSRHSIESLFLDVSCLSEWLWYALAGRGTLPSKDEITKLVAAALLAADADPGLLGSAQDQFICQRIRALTVSKTNSDRDILRAIAEANELARREPATFQQGHARSEFVLDRVREALPAGLQNRVRKDITGLLRSARIETLRPAQSLIPDEIRQVLDHLAA